MRYLLAFLLPALAHAAPTITSRGTGGNNTAATTLVCAPSGTIAAGSMGVLVIAADNAGSGGAAAVCPAEVTDSVGNVWTRRNSTIRDPNTASSGAELGIYTCNKLTTQLTTSDNITVTWDASVSVTAKAYTLTEIVPTDNTYHIVYGGTATGVTGNGANPTTTTSSITSGHVVIGGGAAEASSGAWTEDGDTSNGTWTTQQTAGYGTTTSGMCVTSQAKITTGTATQTYNPALAAVDSAIAWISVYEELIPLGNGNFFQFF